MRFFFGEGPEGAPAQPAIRSIARPVGKRLLRGRAIANPTVRPLAAPPGRRHAGLYRKTMKPHLAPLGKPIDCHANHCSNVSTSHNGRYVNRVTAGKR